MTFHASVFGPPPSNSFVPWDKKPLRCRRCTWACQLTIYRLVQYYSMLQSVVETPNYTSLRGYFPIKIQVCAFSWHAGLKGRFLCFFVKYSHVIEKNKQFCSPFLPFPLFSSILLFMILVETKNTPVTLGIRALSWNINVIGAISAKLPKTTWNKSVSADNTCAGRKLIRLWHELSDF